MLASHRTQGAALAQVATLEGAGYPATVERAEIASGTWYRVYVADLSGPEEARAFAASLQGRLGVVSPWIAPEPE